MNSLFIGRFQPFHKGHKAIVDRLLKEKKSVVIAIRNTPLSEENPFTLKQRKEAIKKIYKDKALTIVVGKFAFCGASAAKPTGKTITVEGRKFLEGVAACPTDLNLDGITDVNDFLIFAPAFGTSCN